MEFLIKPVIWLIMKCSKINFRVCKESKVTLNSKKLKSISISKSKSLSKSNLKSLSKTNVFSKQRGQALLEYLLVFGIIALLSMRIIQFLGKYFSESMGNLAHVMSTHLSVGVCGQTNSEKSCFYSGYSNGMEN
jgi:hypothetical protein